MVDLKTLDRTYVANTYARFPVEIVSGKGSILIDNNGKEYIDMGSGIAVNSFGIGDEQWKNAVIQQLGKVQHTSNLYYTEPCAVLAKMLCERTDMKKVFFSNSGAEANECGIKVARKYAAEKKGKDCYTIVTLNNSFHGRTLTTLAATGQEHYHELFQPLTPGFVHIEAETEALKNLNQPEKIAAFMIECVQGEGGVIPLQAEFVQALVAFAKQHDILLIVDEVQAGNGRTGKLYSYMHYGIQPDIVTTAKGLGGGLPLGATLLSEKVECVLRHGDHGSTFGGNPVCCAGAVNILSRMDEKFLAEVQEKSNTIINSLSGAEGVEAISGLGLMLGIQTKKPAAEVIAYCRENGVLCLSAKDRVRLLPPLNIPMEVLEKAVAVIKDGCKI